MSGKIHHGPPGSYKTSGAVQDDVIPELRKGRVVVTNVRGLTQEQVLTVYPDLPETAEIINVNTDEPEGMAEMRRWFHWAPLGCLLLVDEAQIVFPKKWREKDLSALDYPGGEKKALAGGQRMWVVDM